MKFPSNITVAALNLKPFFQFEKDGKAIGCEGHLLSVLSQALGFDYRIVAPPEKEWGTRAPNGTWTGLINMVLTGKADMGMCTIGYTAERYSAVDFSFPYNQGSMAFATNLPQPLSKEKIYMYSFDVMTWISLFILLLMLPLTFTLMTGPKTSYIEQLLANFGNLLHQPTNDDVFVGRFVMICWWFVSLILSTSFTAGLSSMMAVPFTEPTIQDYRELLDAVEGGSYQIYSMAGTANVAAMVSSMQPHFIKLAGIIVKNNLYAPREDFLKPFKPKSAMVGPNILFNYWYGKPPLSTKYISDDNSLSARIGIIVGKNFCCTKQLNDALLKILGGGIFEKLMSEEFFKSWLKAPKEGFETSHDVPLTLNDVSGAFILLLCGFVISFVVFFWELAYMRLKK